MCGRFVSSADVNQLELEFDIDATVTAYALPRRYNVAPTDEVYIVAAKPAADGGTERQLRTAQWGLIPSWSKDSTGGARMINARSETAATKPSFRSALKERRCVVPATGYYEWARTTTAGKTTKQPYFIAEPGGATLAMAGLFEWWRDPARPDEPPLWTCSILTTAADPELAAIHDRMPVALSPAQIQEWLTPGPVPEWFAEIAHEGSSADPVPGGHVDQVDHVRLRAVPVSTAVGNVANDNPTLIEPVELAAAPDPQGELPW